MTIQPTQAKALRCVLTAQLSSDVRGPACSGEMGDQGWNSWAEELSPDIHCRMLVPRSAGVGGWWSQHVQRNPPSVGRGSESKLLLTSGHTQPGCRQRCLVYCLTATGRNVVRHRARWVLRLRKEMDFVSSKLI